MMRVLVCFWCLLVWLPTLSAQTLTQRRDAATLTIKLPGENATLRLSDDVEMTATVEVATETPVEWTPLAASVPWTVVQTFPVSRQPVGYNRVRWKQRVVVAPLVPGKVVLQAGPLRVGLGDGEMRGEWQAVDLVVTTVVVDPRNETLRDVADFEPSVDATPHGTSVGWWLILAGGALAGGGVAWWWRRQRPVPPRVPMLWALQRCARLEQSPLLARGATTRFLRRLRRITLVFLEQTRDVPAQRRTSAELLALLPPADLQAPGAFLPTFLARCDLAQYAGETPAATECREWLRRAQAFFRESANSHPLANQVNHVNFAEIKN